MRHRPGTVNLQTLNARGVGGIRVLLVFWDSRFLGGPGELSPEEQSDTENPARPDAADASSAVNAIAL
jgi:hypothetical protein